MSWIQVLQKALEPPLALIFNSATQGTGIWQLFLYLYLNQFSSNLESVFLKNKIPTLSYRALKINLKIVTKHKSKTKHFRGKKTPFLPQSQDTSGNAESAYLMQGKMQVLGQVQNWFCNPALLLKQAFPPHLLQMLTPPQRCYPSQPCPSFCITNLNNNKKCVKLHWPGRKACHCWNQFDGSSIKIKVV